MLTSYAYISLETVIINNCGISTVDMYRHVYRSFSHPVFANYFFDSTRINVRFPGLCPTLRVNVNVISTLVLLVFVVLC